MIGDLSRRAQVPLQRGILHELDIAKIGEPFATD